MKIKHFFLFVFISISLQMFPKRGIIRGLIYSKNYSDTIKKQLRIPPEFQFWIPNTFTPNNDGLNDVFKPKTIGVINYEFEIYDQWGEMIFSTIDTQTGWNGSYKGKDCKEDVYVWRVRFTSEVNLQYESKCGRVFLLNIQK